MATMQIIVEWRPGGCFVTGGGGLKLLWTFFMKKFRTFLWVKKQVGREKLGTTADVGGTTMLQPTYEGVCLMVWSFRGGGIFSPTIVFKR